MAIRRCPYCKAIIDESSEYCSNCGTRLLFPEDEFIEEEIPGEKIIDEELKKGKSKLSGRNSSKKEESKLEEKDEDNTELKEDEGELAESTEASEEKEELAEPEEPVEEEKEEESQKEFAFKTEELKKMVDPAEKEKQEIESFLESIKKEREEKAVSEEEIPPDSSEIEEGAPEAKDELPPWAEKIKESPSAVEAFSEEEEVREELPIATEEPYEEVAPIPDSGVGIPEGVDQKRLPFNNEKREKIRGIKIRPPSELSVWLKSKVFDLLFIGVIWIVALWFASRVMAVPLFKLISASVHSVVIFYLVLLISYFFLFLYFLGETLGEHLFSKQE